MPHGSISSPTKVAPVTAPLVSVPNDHGVPLATIQIGRDKPVRVILDTGSTGLRVLASAVPTGRGTGVRLGAGVQRLSFGGQTLAGRVDRATVTIGGVRTRSPIPLQVITKDHCDQPQCPLIRDYHAAGILGIGLPKWSDGLPSNPLLSLPAPYDATWSVAMHRAGAAATGTLVLGASMPSTGVTIGLRRFPGGPNRFSGWDDRPRLCMMVLGKYVLRNNDCGPTVLDTGASGFSLNVPHNGLSVTKVLPPQRLHVVLVVPGNDTTLGHQVWSFTTGKTIGVKRLVSSSQHLDSAWGVALFYARTITWNATRGQIAISH
jgi:hypothetical protein